MNPVHRDTDRSAGLHLFQELSTLGQQLTPTVLLRQDRRGCQKRKDIPTFKTCSLRFRFTFLCGVAFSLWAWPPEPPVCRGHNCPMVHASQESHPNH
jgi:hypothetical protein